MGTYKRLGRYRLLEEIGRGGSGTVYRARDRYTGKIYAVKTFPYPSEDNEFERFKREAQSLYSLKCPGIVRVYSPVMKEENTGYIVMEYVPGIDLKRMLEKEGTISPANAFYILGQVLGTLGVVHKAGIIHRDIKPSNILLTSDLKVKLADFGLALLQDMTRVTKTDTLVGTPMYMSPEQVQDIKLDCRVDLWACAVVFYEMITGTSPFSSSSSLAMIRKIVEFDPPLPGKLRSGIPDSCNEFIMKGLAKDITKRFENAESMLIDVKKILQEPEFQNASIPNLLSIPSCKPDSNVCSLLSPLFLRIFLFILFIGILGSIYWKIKPSWYNSNLPWAAIYLKNGARIHGNIVRIDLSGKALVFIDQDGKEKEISLNDIYEWEYER